MSEKFEDGFYVAVVGDGDEGEPIRVQDGKWYSVGCADPHDLSSVFIIGPLKMGYVPDREARAEQARWAKLREENYQEYRRQYRNKLGHDPGHRRWPSNNPKGEG